MIENVPFEPITPEQSVVIPAPEQSKPELSHGEFSGFKTMMATLTALEYGLNGPHEPNEIIPKHVFEKLRDNSAIIKTLGSEIITALQAGAQLSREQLDQMNRWTDTITRLKEQVNITPTPEGGLQGEGSLISEKLSDIGGTLADIRRANGSIY